MLGREGGLLKGINSSKKLRNLVAGATAFGVTLFGMPKEVDKSDVVPESKLLKKRVVQKLEGNYAQQAKHDLEKNMKAKIVIPQGQEPEKERTEQEIQRERENYDLSVIDPRLLEKLNQTRENLGEEAYWAEIKIFVVGGQRAQDMFLKAYGFIPKDDDEEDNLEIKGDDHESSIDRVIERGGERNEDLSDVSKEVEQQDTEDLDDQENNNDDEDSKGKFLRIIDDRIDKTMQLIRELEKRKKEKEAIVQEEDDDDQIKEGILTIDKLIKKQRKILEKAQRIKQLKESGATVELDEELKEGLKLDEE